MKDKTYELINQNLGLNIEKIKTGIEKDIIKEEKNHFRFDKQYGGVRRGTCIFKNGETIPGFPKIRRAMTLAPTIEKNFRNKVAVEEKMNGYNVRIAKIEDKIYALTRSGINCPYTSKKAKEKLNLSFLDKNPKLFICGEMVGPDNPYVPTNYYNIDSIDFFVFDIRKKQGGDQLTVSKRRNLTEKFNLKDVRLFGYFKTNKAPKKIKNIIKELGNKEREGVVIKDPKANLRPIKYTSSESNCSDLKYAYKFYYDYGSDFVHSRTVREGFQSYEWDENESEIEERAKRVGMSILKPMINTISKKDQGRKITETVKIKVSKLETAEKFTDHLKDMGIDSEVVEIKELNDGDYRVFIDKLQESTEDKTKSLLNGELW